MLRRLACGRAALFSPLASWATPAAALSTTSMLTGDPRNGTTGPIHLRWTDKVGLDAVAGTRLSAGPLLSMLDMCAAQCAQVTVDKAMQSAATPFQTCTVGVTNTVFMCPILHGDAVRLDARVVNCGTSSMGIYIRFFRLSPTTHMESLAGESFFTMVAITPDLKAAKIVPAVELTDTLDISMHTRYNNIREIQKRNAAEHRELSTALLTPDEVDCPVNRAKPMHVTINSTKCEANRTFFSSFLNNNNTVFGGELMSWMERHAVHCAQMFTRNRSVYTIGMHSVAFDEPVFSTDSLTLEACVIYVRNTTMEVDVQLRAERRNTGAIITNRASFVLINDDDIGQKTTIHVGIDLQSASQDELKMFMRARSRYNNSVQRKEQFKKVVEEEKCKMSRGF